MKKSKLTIVEQNDDALKQPLLVNSIMLQILKDLKSIILHIPDETKHFNKLNFLVSEFDNDKEEIKIAYKI